MNIMKYNEFLNEKYIPVENLVYKMAKYEVSKKERLDSRKVFSYNDDLEDDRNTKSLVISDTLKIIYLIKDSVVSYNYELV